jgi:hypothetical protein
MSASPGAVFHIGVFDVLVWKLDGSLTTLVTLSASSAICAK